MRIKSFTLLLLMASGAPAHAADVTTHDMSSHGGDIFHMFRLETDYGGGKDGAVASWDLGGWIGSDDNKLWLKSEGERKEGSLESSELWALYSRNIDTFWDFQAGIRHDTQPVATTYAVLGFNGLAPYFFETEAHVFISDAGDVSARLGGETDFLITQKLIIQPYIEANFSAQDVPEQDIGAGIVDGQIGLQTRYEFTRKFAPYVDVHYGRKFGQTSSIAKTNGEDNDELISAIGLRLMF